MIKINKSNKNAIEVSKLKIGDTGIIVNDEQCLNFKVGDLVYLTKGTGFPILVNFTQDKSQDFTQNSAIGCMLVEPVDVEINI